VSGDGVEGDWQPLANLVRVPELTGVWCTPPVRLKEAGPAKSSAPERGASLAANSEARPDSQSKGGPEPGAARKTPESTDEARAAQKSVEPGAGPEKKPESESRCTLSGDKLFLIDAVSVDPDFTSSVTVPDGFVEAALNIPPPKGNTLYIKLRDDPSIVNTAVLPMLRTQP
jgi:hypothetical protein